MRADWLGGVFETSDLVEGIVSPIRVKHGVEDDDCFAERPVGETAPGFPYAGESAVVDAGAHASFSDLHSSW